MTGNLATIFPPCAVDTAPPAQPAGSPVTRWIGQSSPVRQTLSVAYKLAACGGVLAIVGEPGAGKTLLAQHLHAFSPRAAGELVSAELRGTVAPAEALLAASRGSDRTILLGGVGALPITEQARLLSWLPNDTEAGGTLVIMELRMHDQTRWIRSAWHPVLAERVQRRVIAVPSLAERRDDIALLADYYLAHYAAQWGRVRPTLSESARRLLTKAQYRDNVRTLAQAVAQALLAHEVSVLEPAHFPPALAGRAEAAAELGIEGIALEEVVAQKLEQFFGRLGKYEVRDLYDTVLGKVERPLFRLVMEQTAGNQLRAARILGLNRNTLRTRLRKLGIHPGDDA